MTQNTSSTPYGVTAAFRMGQQRQAIRNAGLTIGGGEDPTSPVTIRRKQEEAYQREQEIAQREQAKFERDRKNELIAKRLQFNDFSNSFNTLGLGNSPNTLNEALNRLPDVKETLASQNIYGFSPVNIVDPTQRSGILATDNGQEALEYIDSLPMEQKQRYLNALYLNILDEKGSPRVVSVNALSVLLGQNQETLESNNRVLLSSDPRFLEKLAVQTLKNQGNIEKTTKQNEGKVEVQKIKGEQATELQNVKLQAAFDMLTQKQQGDINLETLRHKNTVELAEMDANFAKDLVILQSNLRLTEAEAAAVAQKAQTELEWTLRLDSEERARASEAYFKNLELELRQQEIDNAKQLNTNKLDQDFVIASMNNETANRRITEETSIENKRLKQTADQAEKDRVARRKDLEAELANKLQIAKDNNASDEKIKEIEVEAAQKRLEIDNEAKAARQASDQAHIIATTTLKHEQAVALSEITAKQTNTAKEMEHGYKLAQIDAEQKGDFEQAKYLAKQREKVAKMNNASEQEINNTNNQFKADMQAAVLDSKEADRQIQLKISQGKNLTTLEAARIRDATSRYTAEKQVEARIEVAQIQAKSTKEKFFAEQNAANNFDTYIKSSLGLSNDATTEEAIKAYDNLSETKRETVFNSIQGFLKSQGMTEKQREQYSDMLGLINLAQKATKLVNDPKNVGYFDSGLQTIENYTIENPNSTVAEGYSAFHILQSKLRHELYGAAVTAPEMALFVKAYGSTDLTAGKLRIALRTYLSTKLKEVESMKQFAPSAFTGEFLYGNLIRNLTNTLSELGEGEAQTTTETTGDSQYSNPPPTTQPVKPDAAADAVLKGNSSSTPPVKPDAAADAVLGG